MTKSTDKKNLNVDLESRAALEPIMGRYRTSFKVDADELEVEGLTIKGVAIATESAVSRPYGEEKLVITEESITNLDQFRSDGISFIKDHNQHEESLGTARNPRVVDGVLRADIQFKNNEEALRIFKDITVDKHKQDLSIDYMVDEYEAERIKPTSLQRRLTTKFSVYDVSAVGIAADQTRFGRADDAPLIQETEIKNQNGEYIQSDTKENFTMTKEVAKESITPEKEVVASNAPEPTKSADLKQARADAVGLLNLAQNHNISMDTAKSWIDNGVSLDAAREQVLKEYDKRSASEVPVMFTDTAVKDDKFREGNTMYSMRGAVEALIANETNTQKISNEAGLAREISQQYGGGLGRMKIPYEALEKRAAFQATADSQGKKAIQNTVYTDRWIEYLHDNTVTTQLGIQTLTGLRDNVTIPKTANAITAKYIGENADPTQVDGTLSNITMSPKEVMGYTKLSDLASIQLPSIQNMLQQNMMTELAVAIDKAVLIDGGANGPKGIISTDGVNSARSTRAGDAAKRFVSFEEVIDLLTAMEEANVPGDASFVAPPKVINGFRKLRANDTDGEYIWTENRDMTTVRQVPGFIWGIPVYKTNNLTKSGDADTDYRYLVGVFKHCYQGFWGNAMDMEIGYVGNDFINNQKSLKVVARHDVAIAYPEAFKSVSRATLPVKRNVPS